MELRRGGGSGGSMWLRETPGIHKDHVDSYQTGKVPVMGESSGSGVKDNRVDPNDAAVVGLVVITHDKVERNLHGAFTKDNNRLEHNTLLVHDKDHMHVLHAEKKARGSYWVK